jgi:hypothetical protein
MNAPTAKTAAVTATRVGRLVIRAIASIVKSSIIEKKAMPMGLFNLFFFYSVVLDKKKQ